MEVGRAEPPALRPIGHMDRAREGRGLLQFHAETVVGRGACQEQDLAAVFQAAPHLGLLVSGLPADDHQIRVGLDPIRDLIKNAQAIQRRLIVLGPHQDRAPGSRDRPGRGRILEEVAGQDGGGGVEGDMILQIERGQDEPALAEV